MSSKNNAASMKEPKKKERSIAHRLHRMWLAKLFSIFLLMDVLIVGGAAFGWIRNQEIHYYGSARKSIQFEMDLSQDNPYLVTFTDEYGVTNVADAAYACRILWQAMLGFVIFEGVIFFWCLLFDMFRIRARLVPLREMAETAQNLSALAFDEHKLQDLEAAISHVSPTVPNDHVVMQDQDLQGIETALNQLLDRMRESYRQQSRFVSDASHELRTPIAVIKGYIDLLDRWGKEDAQVLSEGISAIKKESEHMNRLVEQLLFLARGDSGRQPLQMEELSLSTMMQEVYDESRMIDTDHPYQFHAEAADILTTGDLAMLKQAVRILIDNAAKYTNPGDLISLRVGMNSDYQPYVSVQDNGQGISSQDAAHVFERFYRSDTARNSQTGGTGLGLSIAKWIVDQHHGTIQVLSREGIGTRFTIILPARAASQISF